MIHPFFWPIKLPEYLIEKLRMYLYFRRRVNHENITKKRFQALCNYQCHFRPVPAKYICINAVPGVLSIFCGGNIYRFFLWSDYFRSFDCLQIPVGEEPFLCRDDLISRSLFLYWVILNDNTIDNFLRFNRINELLMNAKTAASCAFQTNMVNIDL